MKNKSMLTAGLLLGLSLLVFSCKTKEVPAWQKFMACAGTNCVADVVAVKDVYLQDPKPLFEEFILTDKRGEDHFVGWLYILRDSVLLNSSFAPTMERFDMQQALITKSREFENDPKYGTWAKSVIGELELLAIASELEGGPPPSDQQYTGTYAYDLGEAVGSGTIKILAKDEKTVRFELEIVGKAPAHNQGTMEGTATLEGNVATISTKEYGDCKITLTFTEDQLEAKTLEGRAGECGFGNNVVADGTYKLVDDLDPFRGEGGDEAPANILGNWVSNDDPKSEIKIADGQYADIYDGKEVAKNPFSYHKTCPEDCGPAGKEPCIKTVGQDAMCYTVIFADGKTLQLSMVGGRGNTLSFKRKK